MAENNLGNVSQQFEEEYGGSKIAKEMAKAMERAKTASADKKFISAFLGNFLGGTGVNKGGVDTGVGKVIQTNVPMSAGYAEDNMLDRAELKATIDARNRVHAAEQAGPTNQITTNTLGTGLVKQDIEPVMGRDYYAKLGNAEMSALEKQQNKNTGTELVPIPIYANSKDGMTKIGEFMAKPGTRPLIREKKPTFEEQIKDLNGLFGGDLPKDITLYSGGIGLKLNPSLSGEQGQQKSSAQNAIARVDEMISELDKSPNLFDTGSLMSSKLPYIFLTPLESLGVVDKGVSYVKSLYDIIQTEITTARGGKQLTPTEIEFLAKWLPQAGMSTEQIRRNLGVVKSSMQGVMEALKRDNSANLIDLFKKHGLSGNPLEKTETKGTTTTAKTKVVAGKTFTLVNGEWVQQ